MYWTAFATGLSLLPVCSFQGFSSTPTQQTLDLSLKDPATGKTAGAKLTLSVGWVFKGGGTSQWTDRLQGRSPFRPLGGAAWAVSLDVVDTVTGKLVQAGDTKMVSPSGLSTDGTTVTLKFARLYGKPDMAGRAFFKLGEGDLKLWWNTGAPERGLDLDPSWLKAAEKLAPTPEHPDGGIDIVLPNKLVSSLEFYLAFDGNGLNGAGTTGTVAVPKAAGPKKPDAKKKPHH
jgi:hypothetical protein